VPLVTFSLWVFGPKFCCLCIFLVSHTSYIFFPSSFRSDYPDSWRRGFSLCSYLHVPVTSILRGPDARLVPCSQTVWINKLNQRHLRGRMLGVAGLPSYISMCRRPKFKSVMAVRSTFSTVRDFEQQSPKVSQWSLLQTMMTYCTIYLSPRFIAVGQLLLSCYGRFRNYVWIKHADWFMGVQWTGPHWLLYSRC
jgi:hypothetical protein